MRKIKLSERLNLFPEYVFSKFSKKILEIEKKSKRKVLNFGQGNPDVAPSPVYINKLNEFIREKNAHLYPGYGANPAFEKALIDWYKKRFNVNLEKDELLPLLGAKDGVSHLPLVLLNEGDEILVPNPGYPAYTDPAIMIGGKVVYYNLLENNNWKISLSEIEKKLTSKSKFIWINFPSNPTGQIITKEELKKVVDFAKKKGLIIIYDNAYSEITFDGFKAPSILEIEGGKDIAVELGTFSKMFSFAGFRMGWIVGNKDIIAGLARIKSQMDSGLSSSLQNLGAFALTHSDKTWHDRMIKSYETRRDVIAGKLKKLGLQFSLPQGGLYIWAKIPDSSKNSEEFSMKLLEEKNIFLTPGISFGKNGDRFVRVSFCVNIDNIEDYF